MEHQNKIKNIIKDTRRDIRYIIWADKKLNRDEKLRQVKLFNYNTLNIRQKPGTNIEIDYIKE